MTTKSRLAKLEKKLQQRQQQQGDAHKQIPERWEDFVRLCTIRSGGQMRQFIAYEYQKLLSRLMDRRDYQGNPISCNGTVTIVKSRQLGCTQLITSKFLHRAALNGAYVGMSFMRNQVDCSAIARRARQMLLGLVDYIKPVNDNVGILRLENGAELHYKNSNKEGSRSSDSVVDFLFDESAFCPNIAEIYAASSPSTALSGDKITKLIVSTPSSKSGWYWQQLNDNNGTVDIEELCKSVASGQVYRDIPGVYWFVDQLGTIKLVLHWTCHPTYNQKPDYLEYRKQQDGTDEETILREYDLRFVDSSTSVFSADIVRTNATGEYEFKRDTKAKYYLGVDTSTIGSDYFTGVLLKELDDKYSLVKLYRKRQESSEYHIYQLTQIIEEFEPEAVGIEVTGGVGALYLEQLSKQFKSLKIEAIRTTGDSKPLMVSTLQLVLERQRLQYPPNCLVVDELLSFRRVGKKLEACPGKHDDVIMGLCFALVVAEKDISSWDFSNAKRFRLKPVEE